MPIYKIVDSGILYPWASKGSSKLQLVSCFGYITLCFLILHSGECKITTHVFSVQILFSIIGIISTKKTPTRRSPQLIITGALMFPFIVVQIGCFDLIYQLANFYSTSSTDGFISFFGSNIFLLALFSWSMVIYSALKIK